MSSLNFTKDASTEQGTGSWRQHRAGCVTGSGFANVIAKSKRGGAAASVELAARRNYRMQMMTERVTGIPMSDISAASLAWGHENEGPAKLAYEMWKAQYGEHVYVEASGFVQHQMLDWVGTSPDGLVGEHGMVEVKCPFNSWNHLMTIINASALLAKALLGETDFIPVAIPEEHIPQIQGNLWVLERQWCDFISYDPRVPPHLQLYVYRVERDEAYIKMLEAETVKFLDEVESNVSLLLEQP